MDGSNVGVALILTILLVTINGMLASAEIAMLGLHESKLRAMAEGGDKKAKQLLHMKQHPSRFLSTIQIGITLAGLLSGAFAADTLAAPIVRLASSLGADGVSLSLISGASTFFVTLLMTLFMLLFGELVPKRIAMAKPEQTAMRAITAISILSKLAKPFVRLLSSSTNQILKLLGVDPNHEERITEEDVLFMMQEGHEQGKIKAVEVEVLSNLFEFTDLRVEDAMTHRTELQVLPLDGTLEQAIKKMSETGLNKFPVIDGNADRIAGILYSKDIVSHYPILNQGESLPSVKECMRQPYFVPKSKMLVELFGEMQRGKERLAVVVDDYGGTSGIITLTDILEEIVGDLNHPSIHLVTQKEDDSYLIDGRIEMGDLDEILDLKGLGEDNDTFSGFLVSRIGYVPKPGQHPELILDNYVIRVEEIEGGFIRSASVRKREP